MFTFKTLDLLNGDNKLLSHFNPVDAKPYMLYFLLISTVLGIPH